jgi:hypothetical protein
LPGWRVHRYVDLVFFGKSYWRIHRRLDAPVLFLGRAHRILFHDSLTATLVARECYPGDPNAIAAANMHIFIDNLCSSDPSFKKYLESMELLNRKKKTPKSKLTKRAQEDPVISFFRKLEEAKRLFRVLSSDR